MAESSALANEVQAVASMMQSKSDLILGLSKQVRRPRERCGWQSKRNRCPAAATDFNGAVLVGVMAEN